MSLPTPTKLEEKLTGGPGYLSNHPRALKCLLIGLWTMHCGCVTTQVEDQQQVVRVWWLNQAWKSPGNAHNSWPREAHSLLEKDLCPHHPLILLPHPEPHTYCTEALGRVRWARRAFACCAKQGLGSIHSFLLIYWLQPGRGGYTTLLISFWSLLLSQECQSTVRMVYLHPGVPDTSLSFSSLGKHTRAFT